MSTEYRQFCSQVAEDTSFTTESSSSDALYTTTIRHSENGPLYACDCPGYSYRGKCKHVTYAETLVIEPCSWNETDGPAQTPQQEMEGLCPVCGSHTDTRKVEV